VLLAVLAFVLPFIALLAMVALAAWALRRWRRRRV
jgi:hypothetical protein